LGQPYSKNDTEVQLTHQLKTVLKGVGLCMLIIDEAQHLVDGNKINKTPAMVADWIKQLMNDVKLSVTLVGTPSVRVLLESNEQLARRFSKQIFLKGHRVNTEAALQEFGNTVGKLVEDSGYGGETDYIFEETSLQMLYYATAGRLGYIAPLLAEAMRLSMEKGRRCLKAKHFETAFESEISFGAAPKNNPFSGKFKPRELVQKGEPFYNSTATDQGWSSAQGGAA
jgi:hypothetical protein